MPTIIDSLVVKLGLDPKDLESKVPGITKGLDDIEKGAKKTKDELKKTSGGFEAVAAGAMKFLAVLGGAAALKIFITDLVDSNSALQRLSQNLNLSISTISAWSNAVEQLGGSASGLQGTMDMLSKAQTELRLTGQSSLIPYFSALGMSLVGVGGAVKPVDQMLLELSDHFSRYDRTTANNIGRMMGIDQGTMNLLLEGRKELELTLQRQKEATVVTKAQGEEAVKLKRSVEQAKQTFVAFGRDLLQTISPAVEKLLSWFQSFGNWVLANQGFVTEFLLLLGAGLAGVAVAMTAVAIASSPITLIVAGIIALAAAIALLWDDYEAWKKGADSFIDWGIWANRVDAVKDAVVWLKNEIVTLSKEVSDFLNKITGGEWFKALSAIGSAGSWVASKIGKGAREVGHLAGEAIGVRQTASPAAMQQWFQQHGWSAEQAAGIAANLTKESGGNTNALGDNGKAYGLAQWHPDRQAAFARWAGHDIRASTLEEQLAFVNYELTAGSERAAGNKLRGATSAREAGAIVSQNYERPGDVAGEAARRGSYAASLMGIPGASATVAQAGSAASSQQVDNSVETHIGEVKIYTAATDAKGIAGDMKQSLNYQFAAQANTGMS